MFTEKQLEAVRCRLAKRQTFNLRSAFKHLDREQKGAVTVTDMREALSEHSFFATDKELQLLMNKFESRYCSGEGGPKITMTDFLEELVPRTK